MTSMKGNNEKNVSFPDHIFDYDDDDKSCT